MKIFSLVVLLVSSWFVGTSVACDSCGCNIHEPIIFSGIQKEAETPTAVPGAPVDNKEMTLRLEKKVEETGHLFIGEQTQYTYFGTLRNYNEPVPNTLHQYEESFVTQTFVGYQFNNWSSIQLNIPYIYRAFHRPSGNQIDETSIDGIGDISLVADFVPYRHEEKDWGLAWSLGGGLKLPTGDPHRIGEELQDGDPNSAIGGHDLALGSGSFDGIVSTGLHVHWNRFFYNATFEYVIRSSGYLGYRYANEIQWSTGPGYELVVDNDLTLALQFRISGSSKGEDTFQGEKETDTAVTDLNMGPFLTMSWNNHFEANLGIDIPVSQDETDFQALPDYRIRGGVTWTF